MLKYYLPVIPVLVKSPYSFRVRAQIPSEYNKNSKVINYLTDCNKDDIVVLAKKHTKEDVDYLISKNINYIFDVSDDKWDPQWGPEDEWNYTCKHAKHITTTCQRLKEKVIEYTGRKEITVIPDPTERPEEEAKFRVSGNMKLVYYGSHGNMKQIDWISEYKKILKKRPGTELKVITNKPEGIPKVKKHPLWYKGISRDGEKALRKEMQVFFDNNIIDWTYGKQGSLVRECDLVVLPVNKDDHMTQCKGNNRPVDALRLGRFVITTPGCPSYESLKDYIWIGKNIVDGYLWAINNPEKVLWKIQAGQKHIRKFYTPEIIGNKWKELYENISSH